MNKEIKKTPLIANVLGLMVFGVFTAISGCSVVDEKSQPQEQNQVTTSTEVEQTDQSAATASKQDGDESVEAKDDGRQSVEVIEPKIVAQPEIKLEPIPEITQTSPESKDADEEVKVTTEKAAATDETTENGGKKGAVSIAKAEPAIVVAPMPEVSAPISKGPNHFVITVDKKDASHPHFGEGHEMGFLINGVPGGDVVVERGKTYQFQVSTDPKHDVYISKKSIGWGGSPWTEGVEGAYIYEGTITFTPNANAPDTLYYSCRNHPHMGGKIHVIAPGEKVDVAKLTQTAPKGAQKKAKPQISVAMVKQKLMFADMLVKSASSSRIKASDNAQAKQMQTKAESLLGQAKDKLKAGQNADAFENADEALKLLKQAAKLVPSEDEIVALKDAHKELLASLKNFEQSHKESYERTLKSPNKDAAVDYDKKHVESLKQEAQELAKKNDYFNSNQKLETAQRIITTAIQKMLNSQTIVYDLNFESPEEEYQYELKRFGGYEELIPVAVEQKRPNEGTKKLMDTFVQKGQKMRDIAVETAKKGDYPRAIAMMQDATKEVRRALRMVGVMQ